jgi:hypothetical protein
MRGIIPLIVFSVVLILICSTASAAKMPNSYKVRLKEFERLHGGKYTPLERRMNNAFNKYAPKKGKKNTR